MNKKLLFLLMLLVIAILVSSCKQKKVDYESEETRSLKEITKAQDDSPKSTQPAQPVVLAPTPIVLEVKTREEVFPSSGINTQTPILTVERSGELEDKFVEVLNDTVELEDLVLDVFMNNNLEYKIRARWETNVVSDVSNLFIYTADVVRISGKSVLRSVETLSSTVQSTDVEMESNYFLEGDREYIFTIQSCFALGGCLQYNTTIITPSINTANINCNKIVDHGQNSRKLNLLFVPYNYTYEELVTGKFDDNINKVMFKGDAASFTVADRRSFFEIPLLNRSFNKFNVFVVRDQIPCCFNNQLLAVVKACGLDKTKDIIVAMRNETLGNAYAQDIGTGFWILLPKGDDWKGAGSTLAHELGHLIGMDEEYYLTSGGTFRPRNAPNCDYGNLTCKEWCSGVKSELVGDIHKAKREYDRCFSIFNSGNVAEWQNFCPTLNFDFEMGPVYGAENINELCAKPLSELQAYVCYAGTFIPLEDENLGLGCQSGFGCYFGCGTQYYYTRSDYTSIMGGGALGMNNRIYQELDASSAVPILPDYSRATSEALEEYFNRFD